VSVADHRRMSFLGVEQLVAQLSSAVNVRALYVPGHPRVAEALERLVSTLAVVTEARSGTDVTFLLVGDDLVVDQRPLRKGKITLHHFITMLRRQAVERLTMARGLEPREVAAFVEAMVTGQTPRSSEHLIVGQIALAPASPPPDSSAGGPAPAGREAAPAPEIAALARKLDLLRDAFARLRDERKNGLGPVEEIVWKLIAALSDLPGGTIPLAALKNADEYLFVHSVNVALLTLAQGLSFGFQGPVLHAIGVAALLHDVGKLLLPRTVLEASGPLSETDWKIMMTHPQMGAAYLSELPDSSALSVVVAYEHHLRYDGMPAYPRLRRPRRPTLASQMTAISDAYDTLTSGRTEPPADVSAAALRLIAARAGTYYDPVLAENFRALLEGR
jgi:HD-GYP domain-containing protein (c-di-GMP phosphodiesterase class II)